MQIKPVTVIILCVLILFSSCRAYDKGSIDIARASKENIRVKVKTRDGRTLWFKKIIEKDGDFYGIINSRNPKKNIKFFEKDILKIRRNNKKRSNIATITTISIITGFITYTLACGYGCKKI